MSNFSPREIVSELDRYIIGQNDAKRAVAIALRNRWRRQQLEGEMREEVLPKNILMIGPTGVGKTEISRRLAKLANAPFLKVEATKFTEVGYVGRDVDQIIRDLLEVGISLIKVVKRAEVKAKAESLAEERVLTALVGPNASPATRETFRKRLRSGELNDKEIEIQVADTGSGMPAFEIPGMPGASVGMINLNDMLGKALGGRTKTRRISVLESYDVLVAEESDKLLDNDQVVQEAIKSVENDGIVFLDEIDKISARSERSGADVSREGVQRDLLPLIEGTTVGTKYGPVKTDHILFIASGAFHMSKPSDLLPELQGRLPIRVELRALTAADFKRILREPKTSLIKQYIALMATEGVTLEFTDGAIDAIADTAAEVNSNVENIGARRLSTIMERILDEISFEAADKANERVVIDEKYVVDHIGDLAKNADLSKFIL
ncbi:MAG: ATP-dependent protease ATPase subunit HslU [Chitinophagales bacterium]|nr:ATP-dependent protease ATPase subunit HslU [Hyphomicrobiales bacterium]